MKCFFILALLLTSCLGCNDAATQQKADQTQQSAVAAELKQQGEAMHNAQENEPGAESTSDVAP